MIEIRLCKKNDTNQFQEFINSEWKMNHILATNTELLNWQHYNSLTNNFNIVLAYDTLNCIIVGVLGFIPLNQYDDSLIKNKDLWLAIWKVKEGNTGIGLELLNYIIYTYQPNTIGSIGINKKVKKLYKALNFKTGVLVHYYFLNPNFNNFQILKISSIPERKIFESSKYSIRKLDEIYKYSKLQHHYLPHKSIEYIKKRYINHPIYKYQLYGIFSTDIIKCILVTRKIIINNSACIRIIDIYGNLNNINSIASELLNLLINENCEYIDCLNSGISSDVFFDLGFSIRENITIPNYFEPFEPVNIDIEFAYLSSTNEYVIFKGDSDQDRPNILYH
jgi:hypothetical protein